MKSIDILKKAAEETGWNESSMLAILTEYIDAMSEPTSDFEKFIRQKVLLETGPGPIVPGVADLQVVVMWKGKPVEVYDIDEGPDRVRMDFNQVDLGKEVSKLILRAEMRGEFKEKRRKKK